MGFLFNESNNWPRSKDEGNFYLLVIFIDMDVKISENKLDKLKDIIIDMVGIDKENLYKAFQSRMGRVEFLTPGTRQKVIGRYDQDYNYISVFDDIFYDFISNFVGSRKVYDLIKEDLIKRIFKMYTVHYPSIYKKEPKIVKFVDNDYNKV